MRRRSILGGLLGAGVTAAGTSRSIAGARRGRYPRPLRVEFGDKGRQVKLLEPFAYIDPSGLEWRVAKGASLDGASIPQAFWSIVGGPFDGPYRKASVVHDWYCDLRVRPWQHVHRMFYEAMIDAGVGSLQAKVMYLAVWAGGPRWNQQAIDNARLATKAGMKEKSCFTSAAGVTTCALHAIKEPENYPAPLSDPGRLRVLAADVRSRDLSLSDIEALFPAREVEDFPKQIYVYDPVKSPDAGPVV